MLIGIRKEIANMCIEKLEKRLDSYERLGYPFTYGMKGLAELNMKEGIQSKIKAIKNIMHRPGDDTLADIDPYCEAEIDMTIQKKEAEKHDKKLAKKLNRDYQRSKTAKHLQVREKDINSKKIGGSAKKRTSHKKRSTHKKRASHKKRTSHKKRASHKKRVSRKKRVSHKKRSAKRRSRASSF
jgi:hypothetical protein